MAADHPPAPDISVIMVAYNSEDFIGESLRALEGATSRLEVIVVDNSEEHLSLPVVDSTIPSAVKIASSSNLGFAKAVNLAARASNAEYILLLNPDCIIRGTDIDALLGLIRSSPEIGVLAPTIVHPAGRLSVRSAGYEPTARHMLFQFVGLSKWKPTATRFRGFNLYPNGENGPDSSVDWVSGACLLTRRSLWNELEGLSERWFMYAEDIEFCRRVRNRGFSVVHTSMADAQHVVGASSESDDGPVWTLWIENLAEYYVQEFSPNALSWLVWRWSAWATYWSRAQLYGLKSLGFSAKSVKWNRERKKFLAYAGAAWRSTALLNSRK